MQKNSKSNRCIDMAFTVFISHSKTDVEIVKALYSTLKQNGINAYVAELQPAAGLLLSEKIFRNIELSDCVLALLTQESIRSNWVQQEIGIAAKAGKLIIPVIEKGVKINGILEGREYIEFDKENPWNTVAAVSRYAVYLKEQKEQAERARAGGLAVLAIFAGLFLIAAFSGEK
jgi:hypothetical protein